jgi:hypothetical protein
MRRRDANHASQDDLKLVRKQTCRAAIEKLYKGDFPLGDARTAFFAHVYTTGLVSQFMTQEALFTRPLLDTACPDRLISKMRDQPEAEARAKRLLELLPQARDLMPMWMLPFYLLFSADQARAFASDSNLAREELLRWKLITSLTQQPLPDEAFEFKNAESDGFKPVSGIIPMNPRDIAAFAPPKPKASPVVSYASIVADKPPSNIIFKFVRDMATTPNFKNKLPLLRDVFFEGVRFHIQPYREALLEIVDYAVIMKESWVTSTLRSDLVKYNHLDYHIASVATRHFLVAVRDSGVLTPVIDNGGNERLLKLLHRRGQFVNFPHPFHKPGDKKPPMSLERTFRKAEWQLSRMADDSGVLTSARGWQLLALLNHLLECFKDLPERSNLRTWTFKCFTYSGGNVAQQWAGHLSGSRPLLTAFEDKIRLLHADLEHYLLDDKHKVAWDVRFLMGCFKFSNANYASVANSLLQLVPSAHFLPDARINAVAASDSKEGDPNLSSEKWTPINKLCQVAEEFLPQVGSHHRIKGEVCYDLTYAHVSLIKFQQQLEQLFICSVVEPGVVTVEQITKSIEAQLDNYAKQTKDQGEYKPGKAKQTGPQCKINYRYRMISNAFDRSQTYKNCHSILGTAIDEILLALSSTSIVKDGVWYAGARKSIIEKVTEATVQRFQQKIEPKVRKVLSEAGQNAADPLWQQWAESLWKGDAARALQLTTAMTKDDVILGRLRLLSIRACPIMALASVAPAIPNYVDNTMWYQCMRAHMKMAQTTYAVLKQFAV